MDYAYMDDDKDKRDDKDKGMPTLILTDKASNMKRARVVPITGLEAFATDRVNKDVGQLAYTSIISKRDQKTA